MSLLTAGLDFGSGLISNIFNIGQAKKQREHQMRLAEYSYSKDLEMWQKANEYNSPEAQMKRLESAGLNPNLVYGSGSVTGNTTTQTPKFQAFTPEYAQVKGPIFPNVAEVLGKYQDLKIKKIQMDNATEELKRKQMENAFLGDYLGGRNQNLELGNRSKALFNQQKSIELGKPEYPSSFVKDSPFLQKYQGEIKGRNLDNQMKALELNLFGKGITKSDHILFRMFVQNGLFDGLVNYFGKKTW